MRAARIAVVALLVTAALHGARGVLLAHAMLVSSEPAAESAVASTPARIRLAFSEEIEPALAHVSLIASDGHVTRLRVAGDAHDVNALIAEVAPLSPGAYRVAWHVVSADGHPVGGSFPFWVGAKAGAPPSDPANDERLAEAPWGPAIAAAPVIPALLRGAAVGTAMALAGLLLFLPRADSGAAGAPSRAHALARWLAAVAAILFTLHFLAWATNTSETRRLTSAGLAAAAGSDVGRLELWRIGLSLLVCWALLLARRRRIALVLAAAVLAWSGASGHSAALSAAYATPAKSIHLLAAAAWLGGLLWLLVGERGDAARFRGEAFRVSAVALWASILVAISGIAMSLLFLATPRDLVRSAYGIVLLAKVGGLLVLLGFGAYHRLSALPAMRAEGTDQSALATTVGRELAIMIVVVLLGGFLAYVPPPRTAPSHSNPGSLE